MSVKDDKRCFFKKKKYSWRLNKGWVRREKKSEYNFYEIFILDTIHWSVILGS